MLTSIRARVICAFVALVVFSVVVSTAANYLIARNSMWDATDSSLSTSLNDHARVIGDWVAEKTRLVDSLQDVVLTDSPDAMLKQIQVAGGFFDVGVGYPDKKTKFTDWPNIPATYDPTTRPWYKGAVEAGKPAAIPYISTSKALLVALAIPVMREGKLKAVLVGDVALDSVVETIKAIHPTPESFGMLIDKNGRIIAHPNAELRFKQATDIAPEFAQLSSAADDKASAPMKIVVDGRAKLVRAQKIRGTDWSIVIAIDESEAMAGARSLLNTSLLSLILIVGIASVIGVAVTATAFRRLGQVSQAMAAIGSGSGDLTQRLPDQGKDEVAVISRSFNQFVGQLQNVMLDIRDASEAVRTASNEIATANQDLSTRTESAAASLEQTAASMAEISETVGRSTAAAKQADQRSSSATEIASQGGKVVSDAVTTIGEIEKVSGQIGAIITVIDGIAFQTNILALNAAVEAARAGEQGRGFAVVAHEVRSLAKRSAEAAREVKELVETTVSRVSAGSVQVRQAGTTMGEIVTQSADVQSLISGIARATDEQMRGIQEVNRAVIQLDSMVQQNAALVEQSAAASATLQAQANTLASTIGRFRIS
ncbi:MULTISPECIES: methyl-accepting chemotaxis protein [unclassified Herbaspirillum]|uniref:methyl-accepting chemotaxis protein n=1 Tax=unclassified Herbaspirillum TaxID=2624150 RepID=UPI000C0A1A59|nr:MULTISPECIES: methyl-accepting chemotaxis protein [unclassified Herbaspirillum]MAF05241.1 chemotaxis protein [Herbaspirillum sp.]MBO18208.1 chemotaxis protein [Herbaspirillum sp.]|tara:strand:- start:3811 stop:5604 length:1794 start_codon:yes stop_codon:yes gene_type:complete